MATFKKRNGKWFVQVRRKSCPSQSRTFATKAEAQAWALSIENSNAHSLLSPVSQPPHMAFTLGDLIERYRQEVTPQKRSHHSEYARLGKILREDMCTKSFRDLAPTDLAAYRDRRVRLVSPATVVRELSLISHAIETARREWGLTSLENPVLLVRKPRFNNARHRRLQPGELEQLQSAISTCRNPYVWPILHFAIETGMRRGEILNLKWRDVDLASRTIFIPLTKTDKPRTIPLTQGALAILRDLTPSTSSDTCVFPVSSEAFKLAWRRVLQRSGLHDFHFHDLRHEAISRFFEIGLSMPEVALISGHRDPRMLFRYTHLQASNLANKLAMLNWCEMAK